MLIIEAKFNKKMNKSQDNLFTVKKDKGAISKIIILLKFKIIYSFKSKLFIMILINLI